MTDQLGNPTPSAAQSTETLERQLASLQPGAHVCPIYSSLDERLLQLVPYFKTGIVRGEQCLYIADDASVEALAPATSVAMKTLRAACWSRWTTRESYLRNGRFDPDRMFEFRDPRSRPRVPPPAARASG